LIAGGSYNLEKNSWGSNPDEYVEAEPAGAGIEEMRSRLEE